MNKLLQNAIDNKQAIEYYGSYLIYPRRFHNLMVFNALLTSLKNDYGKTYHIFKTGNIGNVI